MLAGLVDTFLARLDTCSQEIAACQLQRVVCRLQQRHCLADVLQRFGRSSLDCRNAADRPEQANSAVRVAERARLPQGIHHDASCSVVLARIAQCVTQEGCVPDANREVPWRGFLHFVETTFEKSSGAVRRAKCCV